MPALVIIRVEALATIDAQTDEDLTFEGLSQNPFTNEDDAKRIKVDVDTGVDDEGGGNYDTGIGIKIPGVEMDELDNSIPGVEEPTIKTPGVDDLDVGVYLELDT